MSDTWQSFESLGGRKSKKMTPSPSKSRTTQAVTHYAQTTSRELTFQVRIIIGVGLMAICALCWRIDPQAALLVLIPTTFLVHTHHVIPCCTLLVIVVGAAAVAVTWQSEVTLYILLAHALFYFSIQLKSFARLSL